VALFASLGEAFSPSYAKPTNPSNPAARKVELARAKVENIFGNEYTSMVDSMKMVSGGAQAEEYYEGEWSLLFTFNIFSIQYIQCRMTQSSTTKRRVLQRNQDPCRMGQLDNSI